MFKTVALANCRTGRNSIDSLVNKRIGIGNPAASCGSYSVQGLLVLLDVKISAGL